MSSMKLRMQHTSLQFKDPAPQQRSDMEKVFKFGKRFPIKTGTEAGDDGPGGNTNRELLEEFCARFNHAINFAADTWVAVDKDIIKPRSMHREDIFLASNDHMLGNGHNRIMATLGFEHVKHGVGRLNVGSVHYPTRGRRPGDPNYFLNQKCAQGCANWMQEVGKGKDLAFVNGDFNMDDRLLDWALGRPFTSIADELKQWKNTGHGPIDGFTSYDKDGRVTADKFRVWSDRRLHLFSDHFYTRGVWDVRLLKEAS